MVNLLVMVNEPEDRLGTLPNTNVLQHAPCQVLNARRGGDFREKSQGAFFGN
jgi:hypothetical protein